MHQLLAEILNVVAPVFICAALGFTIAKINAPFDRKMIGWIVGNIGYPTLVLAHLSSGHVAFDQFLAMVGAAVVLIGLLAVIAGVAVFLMGLPVRVFISPMSLGNVGNIGLPVAALAFGEAGLSYSLAFLTVVLVGMFTFGQWLPQGRISVAQILTSPVIYAIVLALVLMGTGTALPKPLASTFEILGGLAIPLMLLTLGHTLATLNITAFTRGAVLALIHLAAVFCAGLGVAALFGFAGLERSVFVVTAMMPPSVATYLFVELYAPKWAPDVASLILVGTILTVLVLPFILTYVA